jgi:hypothetical protein
VEVEARPGEGRTREQEAEGGGGGSGGHGARQEAEVRSGRWSHGGGGVSVADLVWIGWGRRVGKVSEREDVLRVNKEYLKK